jgi:hypothetical protein
MGEFEGLGHLQQQVFPPGRGDELDADRRWRLRRGLTVDDVAWGNPASTIR